jgi:hypothetical protein
MTVEDTTKQTLPGLRAGLIRKFVIKYVVKVKNATDEIVAEPREFKFYVSFSTYDDGRCGEIFIKGDKADPTLAGVLDGFAKVFSIALQHGAPLKSLTSKLRHDDFPPNGFLGDADFKSCTSAFDLIAQYLDFRFPEGRLCSLPRSHANYELGQCPNCVNKENNTDA